jgi:hypothetical protein
MNETAVDDRSQAAGPGRRLVLLLPLLDGVIAAYAVAGIAYLLTGGIDLGVLSVRRFSKPFLLLLLLAALRAAIPTESWLTRLLRRVRDRFADTGTRLERHTPWAAAAIDAAFAVLAVHVVAKLTAFYANLLFPPVRPRPFALPFASARLAETFAAWDSGWYFTVAQRGYSFDPAGQSSIAFFPLYPLLMRALAWPFGGGERALWTAGVLLSYACFFLALTVLHRLSQATLGDRESARRTVLYVAVFPFAYFFTQVYTESLFLLVTVAAVAAAAASRWGWAGLFGFLAALTRPNGILIAVPLGLLALRGRPRPLDLARRALALLPVPAGLGLFCAYAFRLTGDPLAWLHAQGHWGYTVGNRPWVELTRLLDGLEKWGLYGYFFSDPLAPYYFAHGMVALVLLALLPSVFTRLGLPLGAYVAVSLYLPLSGNALEGIGRYAATLFPLFMLLGRIRSHRVHEAILIAGALVLSLLASLFVTLHPMY